MFKHKDINEYLKEKEDSTILLDVRTKEEYEEGHIPGSINVELDYINTVKDVIKDKESKIYLYCRSGHRSGIALNAMKELGYTDLTNIGGIIHYCPARSGIQLLKSPFGDNQGLLPISDSEHGVPPWLKP